MKGREGISRGLATAPSQSTPADAAPSGCVDEVHADVTGDAKVLGFPLAYTTTFARPCVERQLRLVSEWNACRSFQVFWLLFVPTTASFFTRPANVSRFTGFGRQPTACIRSATVWAS